MPKSDKNILIVEDDAVLALTIQEILEMWGFEPDIVNDGQAALTYLEEHVPDVVLLDMHLPKVTGTDVMNFIRGDLRFAATTVVVMTADPRLQYEAEADTISLLKPVTFAKLKEALKAAAVLAE